MADAYRADLLAPAERPIGQSFYTTGYRIGLILAFAGASKLFDQVFQSWPSVYLVMAGFMLVCLVLTAWGPAAPEPVLEEQKPLLQSLTDPFANFFQRQTPLYGSLVLLFIVLYKLSDSMMNAMSISFLKAACFTQGQIGDVNGFIGVVALIVGAIVGAVILKRMSVLKGLLIFGSLQALGIIFYFWLAQAIHPPIVIVTPNSNPAAAAAAAQAIKDSCTNLVISPNSQLLFYLAITVEQFFGGMESSAFGVFLMYLCNSRYSATQLALLTSLMAFSKILAGPAGDVAKLVGWSNFFLIAMIIILPSFVLLIFIIGSNLGKRIDRLHANGMKEELLNGQLANWTKKQQSGRLFTDNFQLAPEQPQLVSSFWISHEQWSQLTPGQRSLKEPLMPDVVIKLQSTQNPDLLDEQEIGVDWTQKMQGYSEKGMKLGLLIDRQNGQVHFYRPNATPQIVGERPPQISCDPELPGLNLNMIKVW